MDKQDNATQTPLIWQGTKKTTSTKRDSNQRSKIKYITETKTTIKPNTKQNTPTEQTNTTLQQQQKQQQQGGLQQIAQPTITAWQHGFEQPWLIYQFASVYKRHNHQQWRYTSAQTKWHSLQQQSVTVSDSKFQCHPMSHNTTGWKAWTSVALTHHDQLRVGGSACVLSHAGAPKSMVSHGFPVKHAHVHTIWSVHTRAHTIWTIWTQV